MNGEQIEKALILADDISIDGYIECGDVLAYIHRLKTDKQLAKTQLKELLSALYQRTSEEKRGDYTAHKGFTLYRKDIIELAKDYGIKEEELK